MRNKFRATIDYDPKIWKVVDGTSPELMAKIAEKINTIKGADCISVNEDDNCPN